MKVLSICAYSSNSASLRSARPRRSIPRTLSIAAQRSSLSVRSRRRWKSFARKATTIGMTVTKETDVIATMEKVATATLTAALQSLPVSTETMAAAG